ncbi:hypothetical protein [Nocardia gamkensis]|uniref:Uncharacterized protein n=1 Tax=Nocardia gamkensis TaxID=352869 RepID=A0A7X6R4C3_9NOCA|nr:hypothetical protein [Nocardia gamkensis]NKY28177.1 hypothetical protein [Nocardia gamkensis]
MAAAVIACVFVTAWLATGAPATGPRFIEIDERLSHEPPPLPLTVEQARQQWARHLRLPSRLLRTQAGDPAGTACGRSRPTPLRHINGTDPARWSARPPQKEEDMKLRIGRSLRVGCAAAAVLAGVAPAAAHADPGYQATADRACTFAFNKEPYLLHKAVVVGGTVKCDPAPAAFRIELQLWHRSGTSNPKPKGDHVVVTQIPNPTLHVATMALDCVPGVWQGKIVMRATWGTGTDEGRKETIATFIQC